MSNHALLLATLATLLVGCGGRSDDDKAVAPAAPAAAPAGQPAAKADACAPFARDVATAALGLEPGEPIASGSACTWRATDAKGDFHVAMAVLRHELLPIEKFTQRCAAVAMPMIEGLGHGACGGVLTNSPGASLMVYIDDQTQLTTTLEPGSVDALRTMTLAIVGKLPR